MLATCRNYCRNVSAEEKNLQSDSMDIHIIFSAMVEYDLLCMSHICLPASGPQMSHMVQDLELKVAESRLRRKERMTSVGLNLFVRL